MTIESVTVESVTVEFGTFMPEKIEGRMSM